MRAPTHMPLMKALPVIAFVAVSAWAGDAQHGAVVAERAGCLECHAVGGQGAGHETPDVAGATDLAERLMPTYTPSALASALWNHTPAMWQRMADRDIAMPAASASDWDDLFIWLYSLQFTDQPGEVARGRQVFGSNACASCHSTVAIKGWAPLDDPVVLVYRLWSHSQTMREALASRRTPWPVMTGRDFMDIAAYIRNTQRLLPDSHFSLPEPSTGRLAFTEKCGSCHNGPMAVENRASNQTWMDLGAAMWNHAPLMRTSSKRVPAVDPDEMRQILAFVWETQYLGPRGNRAAGEHVFRDSGCLGCHRSPATGAPMRPTSADPFTPWSMVALGWGPARNMHQQMIAKGIAWPHLTPAEMNDLAAYLNSLPKQ